MTANARVSAVGTLSVNEWNGRVKPQLMLEDLAVSDWQLFDWRSIQQQRLVEKVEQLPEENRLLVAFQAETKTKLGLDDWDVHLLNELASIDLSGRYLILLDVPMQRRQFDDLIAIKGEPARIYTVFYQKEDSFFTTNPNREQFKWFYAFLLKRKTFSVSKHGRELAKHKAGQAIPSIL